MTELIRHKVHLANLPNIRADQVPQGPENPSKKGVVLIPLYKGTPQNDVAHHAAISACWSRRTWMLHSDVNDYGIEIKFYVENKVRDDAMPILEANFVGDDDIIFFDGEKLEGVLQDREGNYSTFGGKQCASYTDYRFKEYQFIFDLDSDLFVWSSNGAKLPFFQRFFEATPPNTLGVFWWKEANNPVKLGWCRTAYGDATDESIMDWKKRFEAFAGRRMLEKYCDPNQSFLNCHTGFSSFPAKHFMNNRRADCEFLVSAARVLAGSEPTFSLWHSKGNPIFNLKDLCGIFIHHQDLPRVEHAYFKDLLSEETPFLFHYANPGSHYASIASSVLFEESL